MPRSPRDPEKVLRQLEWTVIRRLDGLFQGDYRTLFRGFGIDLADIREYQYGDDVRYIDWNVTARLQTPYVRQFNEDRDITAWFLLDLSPSVDFGSAAASKREMLVNFTAVMARLLTRHGNRAGAVFYSGVAERIIPARGGRNHVLRLLDDLMSQPALPSSPPTDLRPLLATAHRLMKRRSLVFLVSDFLSLPGWAESLALLALRHETLAVRLSDPLEKELPDLGLFPMNDSETGEQLYVDTRDPGFRARFAAAAARRETELRAAFAASGTDAMELSTADDLAGSIAAFAEARKKRSAAATGGGYRTGRTA